MVKEIPHVGKTQMLSGEFSFFRSLDCFQVHLFRPAVTSSLYCVQLAVGVAYKFSSVNSSCTHIGNELSPEAERDDKFERLCCDCSLLNVGVLIYYLFLQEPLRLSRSCYKSISLPVMKPGHIPIQFSSATCSLARFGGEEGSSGCCILYVLQCVKDFR